jgi:hypothetical protein
MFAWADVSPHDETYDWADHEGFPAEDTSSVLRPYSNDAGEVDYWRLELTLNDVGKAFLVLDSFATKGDQQLTG